MLIIEKKDILVLGQQSTDGLDVTKITAKAKFLLILPNQEGSLHYKASNSLLYANDVKFYLFRAKESKINTYSLCLGNVLEFLDFRIYSMKKVELHENV